MWFFGVLSLILVVAKILGLLSIGWIMCFIPLIIPVIFWIIAFIGVVIAAVISDK